MTNIPAAPAVPFLDSPTAPDLFADAHSGLFVFAGNMRVTLESARVNHEKTPGPIARVVIGRLVMPVDAAEAMAKGILELIERQRGQPAPTAQSTPTIQ